MRTPNCLTTSTTNSKCWGFVDKQTGEDYVFKVTHLSRNIHKDAGNVGANVNYGHVNMSGHSHMSLDDEVPPWGARGIACKWEMFGINPPPRPPLAQLPLATFSPSIGALYPTVGNVSMRGSRKEIVL